jgi:hypothetical protein
VGREIAIDEEMQQKSEAVAALEKLLTRSRSEGGSSWAPVSKELWSELNEVFDKIINAVVTPDCDGDLSIEFELVNRTKGRMPRFQPIPYDDFMSDKPDQGKTDKYLDAVLYNFQVASEELTRANRLYKFKAIPRENH